MGARFKNLLLIVIAAAILVLPFAYALTAGRSKAGKTEAVSVLVRYLRASYARDYQRAYRLLSSADQQVKNEKSYVRERGAFSGFTLETARTLAEAIKANAVKTKTDRDRVLITLKVKLPDANKLSQDLLGWDETRLNALPVPDQHLLIQRLQQLSRHGKLPMIEGEEDFELIRESGRWKLYLNWAAGIRVDFHSRVTDSLPIEVSWDQSEVVARTGELFNVHFNVKNTSDKEIFTKVPHRVEPQDLAGYLELVECGIVSPIRLLPREQQKYASTYMIRGDLPDGIKRIAVTYELANVR